MKRLAWITWSDVNELIYCNQRLDDYGNRVGVLGPCWHLTVGEEPKKMFSWLNLGRPDSTPGNAASWDRCSVTAVARAVYLNTPTRKELLASYVADHEDDRMEVSFSPEGKWMAIIAFIVRHGDGENSIEVSHVAVDPVPACR